MGKVILCFLYIFTHTHIVCAEKIEEAKADEAILGLDAHNRDEAMSDDVTHESKEELDEKAGLDAHNHNEAMSDDVAHESKEELDEKAGLFAHNLNEAISDDVAHGGQEDRDEKAGAIDVKT